MIDGESSPVTKVRLGKGSPLRPCHPWAVLYSSYKTTLFPIELLNDLESLVDSLSLCFLPSGLVFSGLKTLSRIKG